MTSGGWVWLGDLWRKSGHGLVTTQQHIHVFPFCSVSLQWRLELFLHIPKTNEELWTWYKISLSLPLEHKLLLPFCHPQSQYVPVVVGVHASNFRFFFLQFITQKVETRVFHVVASLCREVWFYSWRRRSIRQLLYNLVGVYTMVPDQKSFTQNFVASFLYLQDDSWWETALNLPHGPLQQQHLYYVEKESEAERRQNDRLFNLEVKLGNMPWRRKRGQRKNKPEAEMHLEPIAEPPESDIILGRGIAHLTHSLLSNAWGLFAAIQLF